MAALAAVVLLAVGWQMHAETDRVGFPEKLERLVHYTTVRRGNVTKHIMTTPEAIEAVKNRQPIPAGTHFVLVDYRHGNLYRYFVIEKGKGSGEDDDARRGTADWQFQWFWADKSVREHRALPVLPPQAGGRRLPLHGNIGSPD